MQKFARVMKEGLESCSTGSIEQSWREFKDSINEAQKMLPLVPDKDERDRVTEKVREASRMKQEAWMRWAKKPGDTLLKVQYQQLKSSPGRLQMRHVRPGGRPKQKRLRSCMRLQ